MVDAAQAAAVTARPGISVRDRVRVPAARRQLYPGGPMLDEVTEVVRFRDEETAVVAGWYAFGYFTLPVPVAELELVEVAHYAPPGVTMIALTPELEVLLNRCAGNLFVEGYEADSCALRDALAEERGRIAGS